MGARRPAEHVDEAVERELHLPNGPRRVPMANLVLPEDVVPGMHAALVTGAQRQSHRLRRDLADVGAWQKQAVHQGAQAVVGDDRGAGNLAQEARPKGTPQRPARVIGPQAEQEGGADVGALEQAKQPGHALLRAAQRVDVDLEGDECQR